MYLKRLDLQGFKSFPEKVKLEFNPGITAVVGPNGSGKSNVSDAVRWVLGEQRAKSLRGDKMEDIIFAGTETRKPQGFAEVSIVIDNQDGRMPLEFSEVQVTRRVFRSGESEYRINGTTCRLKDVQELFMDTGVGREGYSIIGQGRIDEILNAKGEERRRIFEEATGIVKYKTRRGEAESKLEKEKQNLLRVEDIISELETQLAPLEEQSKQAKRYLDLREQLKQTELALFCTEVKQAEQELCRLADITATAALQQTQAQDAATEAKNALQDTKQQSEAANTALQNCTEHITQVMTAIEKTEGKLRLAEEQMQHDAENAARMQRDIAQKQQQQAQKQQEQEVSRSRIAALRLTIQQQQENLKKIEETYQALHMALEESQSQAESVKDEIFEQMRKSTEAKGEIAKRQAMLEQFTMRKKQVADEMAQTDSRLEQQEVHYQVLEKKAEEQKAQVAFLEKELEALEQDNRHANQNRIQAEQALHNQEREVSAKRSRLKLLSEMERDHEGYYNSVKSLLQLPDRQQRGICGAVGELLQVPEQYEVAIESALGGAMQNVVTRTEEDAKEAITYLKQRRLGRATFLPMTAVRGRGLEASASILYEKGVLGTADTLVKFDTQYQGITSYLLGKILVIESLDDAVRLAKQYRHQYKMVTLEGDLMHAGGSMTGGSQAKKSSHIFGRSREIQALQEQIQQVDVKIQQLQETLQLAQEDLQEIAVQQMDKKLELQKLTVTIHSGTQEFEKMQEDIAQTKQKQKLLQLEAEQLQTQISHTQQDIAKSQDALAQSEAAMEQANAALAVFQKDFSAENSRREQLLEEITQAKIHLTQSTQQLENAEETLQRLREEEQVLHQEEENIIQQIEFLAENENQSTEKQEQLRQQAETLRQKAEQLLQTRTETTQKIAELAQQAEIWEQKNQSAQETIGKLEQELFRIATKQERLHEEQERIFAQIFDNYEMTYEEAQQCTQEDTRAYAQLQQQRKLCKNQMQEIGEVNVGAIAQYQEVKERYGFLNAQKEDILEAEEKLREMIAELTARMEQQFREQFSIISQNFSVVFQEMFGGGKAYLKLANEQQALESAIEIVAQPPGKSLQNMQLLSGGERALTAIAILFSILKMKPSPFCILDEIEAALDDANVRRYAQYLTKFSKETQFIVITHRKGTMEFADVMYGVTMQEKGVSKLISVDFATQQNEVI